MTNIEITIHQPDDWHLHLRDGGTMRDVVHFSANRFARALIMPNLEPPVTKVTDALRYRERILAALDPGTTFNPLMTLYLTDQTSVDDIIDAANCPHMVAAKLYPAGATTNSVLGVNNIEALAPVLSAMQEHELVLCIHGEVADEQVDIFDREARFIDQTLSRIISDYPALRIVMEHITTREAVHFLNTHDHVAATITPQHLLYNRNHLLVGGIRPHYYCLPVLKRRQHQEALGELVASGSQQVFLGTDSAPHATGTKETSCGCAGVFSAHSALEFYAEAFEALGCLAHLDAFASTNGADFYRLPRNEPTVTLVKRPRAVPENYRFGSSTVTPLRAGSEVSWSIDE